MIKKYGTATLAAAALFTAASPANAVITTFASFSPIGQSTNVYWENSNNVNQQGTSATFVSTATANTTAFAPRLVSFSFLLPLLSTFTTGVTAEFRLNSGVTNTPAQVGFGQIGQVGIGGSFSFRTIAPLVVGTNTFAAGSNLLTGTFGGTSLTGARGSTSASFNGSTAVGDTLTYTSDFLSFANVNDSDFAISLSAVTGVLNAVPTNTTPTAALRTFRAVASGTFSTDPAPIVTSVPEPAVWGLMIVGFAMVGLQTRRRVRSVAA